MKIIIRFALIFFLVLLSSSFLAIAQDDITVGATVPPKATDADFSVASNPINTTILNEGDEVTYTIRYKLNLPDGSFPFHLETSWSRGLIQGTGTYVDAMDYVIGSASNAYDGTVPVVDITNRTITWDIPSLTPSASYHTVTYKLRVHSPLSTNNQVSVTTTVNATLLNVPLAPQTLDNTIQGSSETTPTPSPTITSTPAPTSASTQESVSPTATPTPTLPEFEFSDIHFTEITDSSGTLEVTTSQPSSYTLAYGLNKNNFTQIISNSLLSTRHKINLSNLQADTQYFFKIKIVNGLGKSISSDIFTFRTAKVTETLDINATTLTLRANGVIISAPEYENIVLPGSGLITVQLRFSTPELLEKLTAQFDRKDVLGANSHDTPVKEGSTFVETLPGILTAILQIPDVEGAYQLDFNIQTKNGTYLTQSSPNTFYITHNIIVLNANTHQPIEGAHVIIYRYQESYNTYARIDQSIDYSDRTDYTGQIYITLPSGRYKFEVWSIGYPKITQELEIGTKTFTYPTFYMRPTFTISTVIAGYWDSMQGNFGKFTLHLENFGHSPGSRKTGYLVLGFFDIVCALLFLKNQTNHAKKKASVGAWVLENIYLNVFFIVMALSLLLFVLFTIYQGLLASFPYIVLTILNVYVIEKAFNHIWSDYKR